MRVAGTHQGSSLLSNFQQPGSPFPLIDFRHQPRFAPRPALCSYDRGDVCRGEDQTSIPAVPNISVATRAPAINCSHSATSPAHYDVSCTTFRFLYPAESGEEVYGGFLSNFCSSDQLTLHYSSRERRSVCSGWRPLPINPLPVSKQFCAAGWRQATIRLLPSAVQA